jgi:thioredoxin reductase (NADPH)
LYLAKLVSEITIIHRRNTFRAEPILIEQIKKLPNVKFELNQVVDEIVGDEHGVTGIKTKNVNSNVTKEIPVAGVFIAIGNKPNTDIFINQLDMDEGYIKIGYSAATATNIPGIFAAGDVTNKNYHQAIVAAGLGCMAALDAKTLLNSQ